ncbi:MAG: vWA domain-containing protein [Anaerolineae bacterium]|uniref:vWA domain-containing protein n=1 Tax=Thermoflexus sp. TaxID=1969742 RepID=UPI0025DCC5D6|nr:vWA domain-containing protein [Thermoflexus sp.]MCS7350856.1 VWA domain-containing protein [Thermoflexus sp.]MDW8180307.1 vWA domain-containing protein [Anaerolineae bacterium]
MGRAITRRRFLAWLAMSSVGLIACRSGGRPAPAPAPTSTTTPPPPTPVPTPPLSFFEALEAMRRALRASPDHRIARAEALVAARDAEGMVRLVREAITVYPDGEGGMSNPTRGWRWGTRATLRGGAGTPREVAELLAELLRRAGFEAHVVEVASGGKIALAQVLRRAQPAPFAPPLDESMLTAIQRALGLPSPEPPPLVDAEGRESAALAKPLLAALGDAARAAPFRMDAPLIFLPSVRVILNGQPHLVNLWSPEGPIFSPLDRDLPPAPAPNPPLSVTVRVEAAHLHRPAERFVLVEGTWSAEELVGRQVEIAFFPPARTLEEALANSNPKVRPHRLMLVPALVVGGPDVDAETARTLSVVGNPFTVTTGQVLREQQSTLTLDGQPLPPARPPSDVPVIASADLTVNPAAFPLVFLEVTPKDAQGNPIEGLSAAHFVVEEEGRPMAVVMERWARPAPRVLFLLDDSSSLPADFRHRGAEELVRDLATQLKAASPNVQFRVAKIYEGGVYIGANVWTDDPQALPAQVRHAVGSGSRLWEALADAARHGPTAIVMVTDGQATDGTGQRIQTPPPGLFAAVSAGPPAVIIGVGEVDPAMLAELGRAGRLGAFPAGTREEAIQAVVQALKANPTPPYRMSYRTTAEGEGPRNVRLFERYGPADAPRRSPLAEATYTPPPPAQRADPPALSGLFLTVTVGSQKVTRVLGGLWTRNNEERPTPEHLAEVRRALQGRTTLAFEAGAPSPAHVLDDLYTAMLSLRPVLEAPDREAGHRAIATQPLYLPPPDLHAASIPLPDDPAGPLTFETGLRVTLHRVLPARTPDGQPAAVSWLDLLPLTGFRTADADPVRAFRLTAQRTARLALAEALAFPANTVNALKGKTLRVARYEHEIPQQLKAAGADEATIRRALEMFRPWAEGGHAVLLPEDGTLAGWAVDRNGAVWGVLGGEGARTAGGGGEFSPVDILEAAMLASDLMVVAGLGGFSFAGGVWLVFAKVMHQKLEAVTALLAQLPTSADDPAPDFSEAEEIADFSDLRCELTQAVAFEAVSRVGGLLLRSNERLAQGLERAVAGVSALDGASSLIRGRGLFCD